MQIPSRGEQEHAVQLSSYLALCCTVDALYRCNHEDGKTVLRRGKFRLGMAFHLVHSNLCGDGDNGAWPAKNDIASSRCRRSLYFADRSREMKPSVRTLTTEYNSIPLRGTAVGGEVNHQESSNRVKSLGRRQILAACIQAADLPRRE